MAKRKAVRIDDTQRTLTLISESSSTGAAVAQIPNLLMRANRRQYTQCRAYDFRLKIGNVDSATEQNYEIYTLSNAWWVKRSIEMAKGVWLDSSKKERVLLGDKTAKYGDFIIQTHVGGPGGTDLNLVQYSPASSGDDMDQQVVVHDEDLYDGTVTNELKDDSGDKMGFTVGAADTTGDGEFNIFDEYLLTRSITPDADTRAGPYAELFSVDEDVLTALQQDGDQPPWDADAFPSPWVLADTVSVDQVQGNPISSWSRMLTAPLGVVIVKKLGNAGGASNFGGTERILIEARKGTYKGVHAPAYKAMKGLHQGLA